MIDNLQEGTYFVFLTPSKELTFFLTPSKL